VRGAGQVEPLDQADCGAVLTDQIDPAVGADHLRRRLEDMALCGRRRPRPPTRASDRPPQKPVR